MVNFLFESGGYSCVCVPKCCGPVKGLEERYKLGILWNKYIER